MESHALPGTIQITERTHDRLRDRYELRRRGRIDVKGKGPMSPYLLIGRREQSRPLARARPQGASHNSTKEPATL